MIPPGGALEEALGLLPWRGFGRESGISPDLRGGRGTLGRPRDVGPGAGVGKSGQACLG